MRTERTAAGLALAFAAATALMLRPLPAGAEDSLVDALGAWRRSERPLLVVLALNGLRSELIRPATIDGTPLMPNLKRLWPDDTAASTAWLGSARTASNLAQLLSGCSPLDVWNADLASMGLQRLADQGFQVEVYAPARAADAPLLESTVVTEDGDFTQSARFIEESLRRAVAGEGPRALIVATSMLEGVAPVPMRWLTPYDPTPWKGGDRIVDLNRLQRSRMQRVSRMGQRASGDRRDAGNQWLELAGHAFADSLLGQSLALLESPAVRSRLALVVTSLHRQPDHGRPDPVPMLVRVGQRTFAPPATATTGWFARALDGVGPPGTTFAVNVGPPGQLVWRTPTFALHTTSRGTTRLFDRTWDPHEQVDLAGQQTATLADLTARLPSTAWGEELELRLCAVSDDGPIEFSCTLPRGATPVGAATFAGRVDQERSPATWTVVAEAQPRALRVALPNAGGQMIVSDPRMPIYLGERAWPMEGNTVRWEIPSMAWLKAYVAQPAQEQLQWARGRSAGLYVWVVPRPPPRALIAAD